MGFNIDLAGIDKEVSETNTDTSNVEESDVIAGSNKDSRFNINLESILENEEIRNDEVYTNLASAIVAGKAVNKLILEREMSRIEEVRG